VTRCILPYGNRSEEVIFNYTRNAMDYLFQQDCKLIVLACNTASAAALRRLQQTWLSKAWPGRNIIGVVVPTLETAIERGYKKLGVIGTNYMMRSNVFEEELRKIIQGH
jgi:glutamate racemase